MFTLAGVSASARPLVISGMALAMPPVPVLVPTPAPVRWNQSSSVKVEALRPGAAPKVMYWLEPFSWTPLFVAVADTVRETVTVLSSRSRRSPGT